MTYNRAMNQPETQPEPWQPTEEQSKAIQEGLESLKDAPTVTWDEAVAGARTRLKAWKKAKTA
jgi:hypothetical protein